MDNFLKIQNDSDSKWSYVCISMFGKNSGDPSAGTLDIGSQLTSYDRDEYVFPGIIYFCRGTYPPDHCIKNPNLKRDYNAIHKRTFRITGNADTSYKLESDGDMSEYFCGNSSGNISNDVNVPTADQHQSQQHSGGQQQETVAIVREKPHAKALREQSVELCNNMECTEVISYLSSKGCLSLAKKDEIDSEHVRYNRNDRLVTWLRTQPINTFKVFCDALDWSYQQHLSNPLRDYV